MKRELRNASLLSVLVMALAACGKTYHSAPEKIAATVNGEEIAVRHIKPASGMEPVQRPVSLPAAEARVALDSLIDQVLLAQKAVEMQLDRDPLVAAEINAAKQRVLVKRYVEQSIPPLRVNPDEVVAFYRANLPLFEQRQSYRLNELVATVDKEEQAAFKAKVAASQRLDELVEWLKMRQKAYLSVSSIKFSEQLPAAVQPQLALLKNDQLLLLEVPDRADTLSVIQLLQAQDAPLSLSEATPAISNLLLEQKRQKFIQTKARQLRESARIEYLGEFAGVEPAVALLPTVNRLAGGKTDPPLSRGQAGLP